MTLFNYLIDNELVFYTGLSVTVGFIGYKFASSYIKILFL